MLFAFYYQLLYHDVQTPVNIYSNCINTLVYCDLEILGNGVCDSACNTRHCAYDLGDCGTTCEESCTKCVKYKGIVECLECAEGYYLQYTTCVKKCLTGFTPTTKFNQLVCEPPFDDSTLYNPRLVYVSQDDSLEESLQDGTFEHPFSSFTVALTQIRSNYVRILLMNYDGSDHLLKTFNIDKYPGSSSNRSPLDFGKLQLTYTIEVQPLMCSDVVSKYCYSEDEHARIRWKGLDAIQLDIRESMIIKNVDFDGYNIISQFECPESEIYCTYCPYVSLDKSTGKYVNDKGEEVTWKYASRSDCDRYKDSTLFKLSYGKLELLNVRFLNWRAGFFSLITNQYGDIMMENVDFINIKSNTISHSAIISSYECEDFAFNCGRFRYVQGNVKLLNNGFEYNDDISLSGFLYAKGLVYAVFEFINFERNIAYQQKSAQYENTGYFSSLIYLENFYFFTLEGCNLSYNIAERLIYLKIITDDASKKLHEYETFFSTEHINLKSNHFSNIFGDVIKASFYGVLPNIKMIENSYHSVVYRENMIQITLAVSDPSYYYGERTDTLETGFRIEGSDGVKVLRMQSTEIANCYGPNSLIHLENVVHVNMNDLSITHSLVTTDFNSMTEAIQELVYKHFVYQNSYVTHTFDSTHLRYSMIHYGNACYFFNVEGFTSTLIALSDNYSSMGGTDVYFERVSKEFEVLSFIISNNVCNSKKYGTGLSFSHTMTRLELKSITANNNLNHLGYGALYFENFNSQYPSELIIRDSYFYNNSAGYGASMAISARIIMINNVVFENNTLTNSFGGGIYFNQHTYPGDSYFQIENCKFVGNHVKAGLGGVIAIENTLNIQVWKVLLDFRNNIFHNNTSSLNASILFISNEVDLHPDSNFLNCDFKNNISQRNANIQLSYRSGVLKFDSCLFEENHSSQSIVIDLATYPDSSYNITKVVIANSVFSRNSAIEDSFSALIEVGNSIYHSTLETYNTTFIENYSTSVYVNYGYWIDMHSNYLNNQVDKAAVARLSNGGTIEINHATIFNNTSTLRGGAFHSTSKSSLKISNSKIRHNFSYQDGGVVFMDNESILQIVHTDITENRSMKKGSVIYATECSEHGSYISDSVISSNMSRKGGVISLINSAFEISNSQVYGNTDGFLTPGILLAFSSLNVSSTVFRDQSGTMGAGIYATSESGVGIDGCIFENMVSTDTGGAVVGYHTLIVVRNSIFKNLYSNSGSAILAYSKSYLEISDCTFNNSTSRTGGGVIKSLESSMSIAGSIFDTYDTTGIESEKMIKVEISHSKFYNGSGINGGAVACLRCISLNVSNSEFVNNSASYGGAVYIRAYQDSLDQNSCTFSNNVFINNTAHAGGSIYSNNLNLSIIYNSFINNSAVVDSNELEGNGGGIKLECYDATYCAFNIWHNTFLSNFADREGGSIYWKHFEPMLIGNIYENNTAIYGNDVASFASSLSLRNYSNIVVEDRYNAGTLLYRLNNIAPGQEMSPILVALVDNYNKVIETDSSSLAEILPNDTNVVLSGEIKKKAENGMFEFKDFIISATPNSSVVLIISTNDGIDFTNLRSEDMYLQNKLYLKVNLRDCKPGEKESDNKCVPCPEGTYSFDPKEGTCKPCPDEAKCYGEYRMVPKKGYWRSTQFSENFFKCPNKASCLGYPDVTELDFTGKCDAGYQGNLCYTCQSGYTKAGFNVCEICADKSSNIIKMIAILSFIVILSALIVKITLDSAYKPKSQGSIYIKIFVNYLQLISLTTSLDLNFSVQASDFLYLQHETATLSEHIINIDCLINDYSPGTSQQDLYFIKMIAMALIPFVIILIASIVWIYLAFYKGNFKLLKGELISTIIILLFLIHPNLVAYYFSAISCMEIEPGEYWVRGNYDIRCWDEKHTSYVLFSILPGILVWGLGFPAICLITLIRNRRALINFNFRLKFGFLFNGYNIRHFYWDLLILYRKILIIFCATYLSFISSYLQALTISILLITSYFIHVRHNPFNNEDLNEMEKRSILVATVTIYCGLYYLSESLNHASKIIFFIMIIAVNTYFIYFWLYKLLSTYSEITNHLPCLSHILPIRPRVYFTENDLISNKHIKSKITSGLSTLLFLTESSDIHDYSSEIKYQVPDSDMIDFLTLQDYKSFLMCITKLKISGRSYVSDTTPKIELSLVKDDTIIERSSRRVHSLNSFFK